MKVLAEVCGCAGCVCLTGQDSHFEQNSLAYFTSLLPVQQ